MGGAGDPDALLLALQARYFFLLVVNSPRVGLCGSDAPAEG